MTSKRRDQPPPTRVEEALARSARHTRNAIAEASLALIALLDAIALPLTGHHAARAGTSAGLAGRGLAALSGRLAELERIARSADAPLPDEMLRVILDALDAEIARWEARSKSDPDARAVLRAFLGLREILWEFGVRGRSDDVPPRRSDDVPDDAEADAADADVDDGRDGTPSRSAEGDRDIPDEMRSRRRRDASAQSPHPRVQRIRIDD